jgi:hypothetical protein
MSIARQHITAMAIWLPAHVGVILVSMVTSEAFPSTASQSSGAKMELGAEARPKQAAGAVSVISSTTVRSTPTNPVEPKITDLERLDQEQIDNLAAQYAEIANEKNTTISLTLNNGIPSTALGSRYLFHDLTGRQSICIDAVHRAETGLGRYTVPASDDIALSLLPIARHASLTSSAEFSGKLFIDTRTEIEMQRSLYEYVARGSRPPHLESNTHYHATVTLAPTSFTWTQKSNSQ